MCMHYTKIKGKTAGLRSIFFQMNEIFIKQKHDPIMKFAFVSKWIFWKYSRYIILNPFKLSDVI